MKGRGRFIRGAFRRPLADDKNEHAPDAQRGGTSAPEPHDPANDVIDDVPIRYPPQAQAQTSKLSPNARDLLAGREVMLSDSYSDDVSSINDSVYQEAVSRPTNKNLLVGGPEAFQRAASKREEILLLSDAESFGRHAATRVKSLYAASAPKSADGSTAEEPINLLGSQSEDEEDSLESGLSLSSNVLKDKIDEFKNKYHMEDHDTSSNHPEATEVLSNSSNGNSHGKEKTRGPQNYAAVVKLYPRWLRLAFVAIVVSLVGAIVLIALAVSNSSSSVKAGTTTTESITPGNNGNLEFGTAANGDNSDVESFPTPADVNSPAPVPAPASGFALPPVNQPTINSIFALITRAPTANPVLLTDPPTTSPTRATVAVLTRQPTSEPSIDPTTQVTALAPTPSPSGLPTAVATGEPTLVHSSPPTIVPTTRSPTASPTIDTVNKMVIYLTAGPIDESVSLSRFPGRKKTSFLVHLGDWNEEEKCKEEDYQGVTTKFANSSVPVYFVMGDDDNSNCRNADKALEVWRENFVSFEQMHWGQLPWDVFRQSDVSDAYKEFSENFMFQYAGGVFMSINLRMTEAADEVESVEDLQFKIGANLEWIDMTYNEFRGERDVKTIFLFSHDAPNQVNELFFSELYYKLEYEYKEMDFILVHHSEGGGGIEDRYMGLKNLSVIGVEGTVWPPLRMTLEFKGAKPSIEIDQNW